MGRPRKNVETNEATGSEEIAERPEGISRCTCSTVRVSFSSKTRREEIALKSGFVYSPAEVK